MFKKILIANRGEIAVRVAQACHELGIATVGVFSTVDTGSKHLRFMDDSVWIGDSPPQTSYLNITRIVDVAKSTGADAIHPGYGFLAENAEFARACEDAGITFIGPGSNALSLVGDKIASRNTVKKVNVPIIPGMEGSSADIDDFRSMAETIGYPVIVKASLGGGGKGMRIIRSDAELADCVAAGQREAQSAFGDSTVYLEKYIEKPRHIEFQVLRDHHGNVVHLCERECSIQRRHQKIVEETPSPVLDAQLRHEMGEAAKKVITAAAYTNAGTVEFLLDHQRNFYFLEVNARVQVEHPITEMVTGVDIVRQQIKIADGCRIVFSQGDVQQNGHAMESRIYAEDPHQQFMPSPGRILYLNEPQGPGIRVDSGVYDGWNVPPHYDPILSKLIAWAEDREHCIARMVQALEQYTILGIRTNIDFLSRIITATAFRKGDYHTHFIDDHEQRLMPKFKHQRVALVGAALISLTGKRGQLSSKSAASPQTTPWQEVGRWELSGD
ncbi:MAG: acetyl-CoA carboxylase biotin carboxylase subunit [candidate division WOR-3 bacterium]|nr:MAG: acetyl-CoA carboxylase biotin carboxylase subunit [candidate division WOR-3 bacterium]